MRKKFFLNLLILSMLSIVLAGCGNAQQDEVPQTESSQEAESTSCEYTFRDLLEPKYIETATAFAGGTGTKEDPFQISNAAELVYMGEVLADPEKSFNNEYDDAYYLLTKDIELNDTANFANWQTKAPEYAWNPIDSYDFTGVFDGAGHKITGLYINTNCNDAYSKYGLFKEIRGTIANVVMEQSYIAVSGYSAPTGSIVGELKLGGIVRNCASSAIIDCYEGACGGIVGKIYDSEVIDCTFSGTITQVKEDTFSAIGGIVGSGDGDISGCINSGIICFDTDDVDNVGGIIARWGEGTIADCENKGILNGNLMDGYSSDVGGIVGNMYLSNIGGEQDMSHGATIVDCENSSIVCGTYAGGIVGYAVNDKNHWCLKISGCTNTGEVIAGENAGGIVGYLSCKGNPVNGDNVVIENCTNKADLSRGTTGGIIGYFGGLEGKTVINGCENAGNITTDRENCGGIIGYWMMMGYDSTDVVVEGCVNHGVINSPQNAGGIFGFTGAFLSAEDGENCSIAIKDCANHGEIITDSQVNGFIGGIAANWGMGNIQTTITGCTNTGNLTIANEETTDDTLNEEKLFTMVRIAGGIIGRIGNGLLLSVDGDAGNDVNIQKTDAFITLTDCSNIGNLNVKVGEEYKNVGGEQVYINYFGGIVGNASGENAYSVFVENCSYSNFERGLGNTEYADFGTKIE